MPRCVDADGFETDEFECDCCGGRFPIEEADTEIIAIDGMYVCEGDYADYIEDVTYNVEREERFYV